MTRLKTVSDLRMNEHTLTLMQIHSAGLQALARELGPVGMVRFLQQYETGKGDYSHERHEWLDGLDSQTIASEILRKRKSQDTDARK